LVIRRPGREADYSPPSSDEGVSKSFRTGRLERELQMIQLSATKCSSVAILWVSIVSFAAIKLCLASQRIIFHYRLGPETFGYTLVNLMSSDAGL